MSAEENTLIQKAKGGSVEAWENLVSRYQQWLLEYIRQRCPRSLLNHVTAEDILQESLLQAWLDIGSLEGTAVPSFVAWLKAIAHRRLCDARKAQQCQKRGGGMKRVIADDEQQIRWDNLLSALPSEARTASSILSQKERAQALQAAVRVLPETQQRAVSLHFLDEMTIEETAEEMQCTAGAVRGLLHRGKQNLSRDISLASSWIGRRTDVTRLLNQIESGNGQAAEDLLPVLYDELRKLAAQKLRHEQANQTLQPTALVHEAFLRLVGTDQPWQSRGHFFSAAAEAMRRILIDRARKKQSQRHGGQLSRQPLRGEHLVAVEPNVDLLALNEALERLESLHPERAGLVKLRYFAGLSIPQAAEALGISPTTADRYWAFSRAWLHAELEKGTETCQS